MIFLDHNMKLHKMIEMYLKYDSMHTNRTINALICINNHVNSCINCMLSYVYTFYFIVKEMTTFSFGI